MNEETKNIDWVDGDNINEVMFCEEFLTDMPLKCINGKFFSIDGIVSDTEIENIIYSRIKKVVNKNLSKKVRQLIDVLKMECYLEELPVQTDRIHLKNATYYLDGTFTEHKEFCINRLPVSYNPNAPQPTVWLKFMADLLETEDILTLQEFIGYCLIPTNKAQKLLLIIGKGGEGKSRVGLTLRSILGDNMNISSIQKIEHNRFARADLEHRLLMVDDDMKMEALKDTNYIKSIVTLEDKMDLERKGQQSVQGVLYVRFICFGNGSLNALHDRSYGFYRRQLILTTKDRPTDREDDPYLIDKLRLEAEGILLWALEGLHRLINNNYKFTISKRTANNLKTAMKSSNNIIAFMESEGYIRLEQKTMATSKDLYIAYQKWCDDNTEKPVAAKTFSSYLIENEDYYSIKHSTNIPSSNGKKARGFTGVFVQTSTSDYYKKYT